MRCILWCCFQTKLHLNFESNIWLVSFILEVTISFGWDICGEYRQSIVQVDGA